MKADQSRLDLNRRKRLGIVEAIWGEHKTIEQIATILKKFQNASELALVTRVSNEKSKKLKELLSYIRENAMLRIKRNLVKDSL